MKVLDPGLMTHAFNCSTQETEAVAGEYLRFCGQLNLCSAFQARH